MLPRWLDITPTSRVIARCTQDIQAGMFFADRPCSVSQQFAVDGAVALNLNYLCACRLKTIYLGGKTNRLHSRYHAEHGHKTCFCSLLYPYLPFASGGRCLVRYLDWTGIHAGPAFCQT